MGVCFQMVMFSKALSNYVWLFALMIKKKFAEQKVQLTLTIIEYPEVFSIDFNSEFNQAYDLRQRLYSPISD